MAGPATIGGGSSKSFFYSARFSLGRGVGLNSIYRLESLVFAMKEVQSEAYWGNLDVAAAMPDLSPADSVSTPAR
jgi:hypothetical protein